MKKREICEMKMTTTNLDEKLEETGDLNVKNDKIGDHSRDNYLSKLELSRLELLTVDQIVGKNRFSLRGDNFNYMYDPVIDQWYAFIPYNKGQESRVYPVQYDAGVIVDTISNRYFRFKDSSGILCETDESDCMLHRSTYAELGGSVVKYLKFGRIPPRPQKEQTR